MYAKTDKQIKKKRKSEKDDCITIKLKKITFMSTRTNKLRKKGEKR